MDTKGKLSDNSLLDKCSKKLNTSSQLSHGGSLSLSSNLLTSSKTSSLLQPQSSLGGPSLLGSGSLSLSSNLKLTSSLKPSSLSTLGSSPVSLFGSSQPASNLQFGKSKITPFNDAKKSKIETGFGNLSIESGAKGQSSDRTPTKSAPKEKAVRKHHDDTQQRKRGIAKSKKTEKRKKIEDPAGVITAEVIEKYSIDGPDYEIECHDDLLIEKYTEVDLPKFIPPSNDMRLVSKPNKSLTDVMGIKRGLINCVSGSLIGQPNFKNINDPVRQQIGNNVDIVVEYDPEFILKVALYSRKELNIRTTSNYLLALASCIKPCRPYLKKYFSASIALPTDWIEVAEIVQGLEDNDLLPGSIPAALRRAMILKFPEFDQYQLAKYNKESSGKKKKAQARKLLVAKKAKKNKTRSGFFDSDESDSEDEDGNEKRPFRQLSEVSYDEKESNEDLRKQRFTIKQLIRKLHLGEPVENVMSIIGKRYPSNREEFYRVKLPGEFDEAKAGKRMKLPVPETWETQVSLKGNKASTWEDLIDHKKLPFMAMLRNLRNLIKAGISAKHHNFVIRRLCDQRAVINSKQFPFRFFSAYVVLQELEEAYEKNQKDIIEAAENKATGSGIKVPVPMKGGRGGGTVRGGMVMKPLRRGRRTRGGASGDFPWWIAKKMKQQQKQGNVVKEVKYDKALIQRYRKALDTSVKIATVHNVQPIKGRTILLCDIGASMETPCSSAKGLGKPRTLREISTLMGLMCKYACEECEFLVHTDQAYDFVELDKGTILDNMDTILTGALFHDKSTMAEGIPYEVLFEKLRDRVQVDNLLVFGEDFYPSDPKGHVLNNFLKAYRHTVNPNLLFVGVTFSSPQSGIAMDVKPEHENDIYISGYSDAILRFIAERGDSGQVHHVEKIDEFFKLRPMPKLNVLEHQPSARDRVVLPPLGLQLTSPKPRWRTVRVFISSTFRDMHGERDLLTRFVFPELRSMCRKRHINVYEVDLRWGITEEESKDNRTLETCLQEVSRCQLFVGLLGERYGWTPDTYEVPNTEEFDWVRDYPAGASVTELEMYAGALSKPKESRDTAFFFFRDNAFEDDVPRPFVSSFQAESSRNKMKIDHLKNKIRNSGFECYDGYKCRWGGCVEEKPVVAGLEDFGARILNTLLNAVKKICSDEDENLTEETHIDEMHLSMVEKLSADYVGQDVLKKQILKKIAGTAFGVIGLVGKAGCGKSALMASVVTDYMELSASDYGYNVLVHLAGAAAGSSNIAATVRRLASLLNSKFGLGYILPEDFKNLTMTFADLLAAAATVSTTRLVIFIDGLDAMEVTHQPFSLEWLPTKVPDNVVFVLTAIDNEKTHKSLTRIGASVIAVGNLDMWDKASIVRATLAKHRKALNETGFGNQMKLLMLKKEAHNPLYLKLACEELRVFGVYEKMSDKLKTLPHTTAQMLQEILARLESDHGEMLVKASLCLLVCVRDGLYPQELNELLRWYSMMDGDVSDLEDIRSGYVMNIDFVPVATFTFLARSIMTFLNPSSSWAPTLSLANAEICTAVRLRYLKGAAGNTFEASLHRLLAGFFWNQADPDDDMSWTGQHTRGLSELPFHLAHGGCFDDLENVLCDPIFIKAKCELGLAAKLMDDFAPKDLQSKVFKKQQNELFASDRVKQYKSFVSRNIEILVNYPSLAFQQAFNEPDNTRPCGDINEFKLSDRLGSYSYIDWKNKPQEESQCYLTLSNFKSHATCISVSPSGSQFATGSYDSLVRIYDMNTGEEMKFFSGHSDTVTDVCFIGTNVVCSASADSTLSLWDIDNGHRLHTLKGHSRRVNSCAADPKGKLVASGGWDSSVIVWKVADGYKQCDFFIDSAVNCVDFHPTDDLLVVGSWDSLIRIFNVFHKTRVAILRGHSTSVRDIAYSPTGSHLASAALDGDVKLWDATKGSQVGTIKGHDGPINKLIFSPSGRELITAGEDHQIKMWSGDLGIPVQCINASKVGPATSVALSPDGVTTAVGFHTGLLRVYDVATGVNLFEVNICASPIRAVTYSPNGSYILIGNDDSFVQVVDSQQGSRIFKMLGHSKPVLCVTASQNAVASGGEDFTCCVYDSIQAMKGMKKSDPQNILKYHNAPVTSCSINFNEQKLATASRDGDVAIYDMSKFYLKDSPAPVQVLTDCHADWINSCQWSNLANYLITASNDFNLKMWDTKTSKEKLTLKGHEAAINTVAFKHGCIVSGSSDGLVKVWSHKGVEITTLRGHSQRVNACDMFVNVSKAEEIEDRASWAYETDDDCDKKMTAKTKNSNMKDVVVVSAGDDGMVWIWRPLQAYSLATLTGHSDRVLGVSVNKDNHVASCSLDRSIRLWRPRLKDEVKAACHDGPVTFVAVSVDKSTVITGSRDGTVKIWKHEGSEIVMKSSFKAHNSDVTCGCFDANHNLKFVTGGNDNLLICWEIIERKTGSFVRKSEVCACDMPITAVASWRMASNKFFFATWKGDVFLWRLPRQKVKLYSYQPNNTSTGLTPIDTWCTAMAVDSNTQAQLYLGSPGLLTPTLIDSNDKMTNLDPIDVGSLDAEAADADDSKHPRPNWVESVTCVQRNVFAGDSSGRIIIHTQQETWMEKVHSAPIKSIAVVGDIVFTSSMDTTIKVWRLMDSPVHLNQIGQFFSPAPVTSLSTLTKDPKAWKIDLVAGDQLGNVHHLVWHC